MDTKRIALFVGLLLAAVSPGRVLAQTEAADSLRLYLVEGVTVTATRAETEAGRVSQKIDVVGTAELSRNGPSAANSLRSSLALDVVEYPGLLSGFSIRGFRPQLFGVNPRTLVLVDGRPSGTNNLALMHSGSLERIEVLRGPASALYGSSAMGGVVNLITRRSAGERTGAVSVGYGGFGSYEMSARAGGNLSPTLDFDLALASAGQHAGYRPGTRRTFAADSLIKLLPDGTRTSVPWVTTDSVLTFSEYSSVSASGRVGVGLGGAFRVDLSAEAYTADDVQNPGDLNVVDWDGRSLKDVARGSADLVVRRPGPRHSPTLRFFSAREIVDYFSAPVPPTFVNYRTPVTTLGAQLQDVIHLGASTLTVGADFTSAESRSEAYSSADARSAPFSPDIRVRSAAVFAQARSTLLDDRLTASAGGRLDAVTYETLETPYLLQNTPNTERHLVVTPSAGLRYSVIDGIEVYGNLGRGFITPDPFQVAGYSEREAGPDRDAVTVSRGDPLLSPETSWGWDAGLSAREPRSGLDLDLTYFRNSVRDRITTRVIAGTGELTSNGDTILSTTTYVNADRASSSGLEARASIDARPLLSSLDALRLFANGTWIIDAEEQLDVDGATRRTPNVADLTLIGGIDFALDRFGGRLSGRYVGERVDNDYVAFFGEIVYPPYLVADLGATIDLHERLQLGLDLRNLLNEDYFEVRGYNLPGRSLQARIRADF